MGASRLLGPAPRTSQVGTKPGLASTGCIQPHVCRAERGQPLCVSITMQGYAAKDLEGLSLVVYKMQSHESEFQKQMQTRKNLLQVQLKKAR